MNRRAEFVGEDFLNKCFCLTQFRLTDTQKIKKIHFIFIHDSDFVRLS